MLLVSLWGGLWPPWASSIYASTSSWSCWLASMSTWAWSPSTSRHRAPLINQDFVHLPSYGDNKYHHQIILVRNHVFQVGARETESGFLWMIKFSRFQGHHCLCLPLMLGSRAPSSRKSSQDGVQPPRTSVSYALSLMTTSMDYTIQKRKKSTTPYLKRNGYLITTNHYVPPYKPPLQLPTKEINTNFTTNFTTNLIPLLHHP